MSDRVEWSPELLERVRAVKAKRPKAVIDFIIEHGSVTTDDLKDLGYEHAPRAARDVIDLGIPLLKSRVTGRNGRSITRYTFGEVGDLQAGLLGRTAISKRVKLLLLKAYGTRCGICGREFEPQYLQPDHRVPVGVADDEPDSDRKVPNYMLLCGPCNRAKSWSCEHCPNFVARDVATCQTCYWAHPDSYTHVATVAERRLTLAWVGGETDEYDALAGEAETQGLEPGQLAKEVFRRYVEETDGGS